MQQHIFLTRQGNPTYLSLLKVPKFHDIGWSHRMDVERLLGFPESYVIVHHKTKCLLG